jgi:23S rRNA (uracil1939-C5)-methyltransferase
MARDEAVLVPDGWLSRGEAFVRGDGGQLAILGGIPGERVRVRITSRGAHQDRARVVSPMGRPHPDRVEPPCEKWSTCGRCTLMHLSERGRDGMRRSLLQDVFGGAPFPVREVPAAAATDLHYAELRYGVSDSGRPRLGVVGREGGLVAIPACPAVTPVLRELMKVLAHHLLDMNIRPFGFGGPFRGARVRQSSQGELALTLVFGRPVPFARDLAERVAGGVMELRSAHVHWNDDPDSFIGPEPETAPVYGSYTLDECLGPIRLRLGPLDPWTQTPAGAAAHVAAVDMLEVSEGDAVLDLRCGSGARSLLAASRGAGVVGVDPNVRVLERARENAALNGQDAIFVDAELEEAVNAVSTRLQGRRPLVIADTLTRGLPDARLSEIIALSPRRVVLLCSNPRALARDMRVLMDLGLRPVGVDAHDVDPYTPFSLLVARLDHPDTSPPERRAPRRTRVR